MNGTCIRNFNRMGNYTITPIFYALRKDANFSCWKSPISTVHILVEIPTFWKGRAAPRWLVRKERTCTRCSLLDLKSWKRSLSECHKSNWVLLTLYEKCDLPRGNVIWSHIPRSWAKQRYLPWGSRPSSPILDNRLTSFSVSKVVMGLKRFFCVYFLAG